MLSLWAIMLCSFIASLFDRTFFWWLNSLAKICGTRFREILSSLHFANAQRSTSSPTPFLIELSIADKTAASAEKVLKEAWARRMSIFYRANWTFAHVQHDLTFWALVNWSFLAQAWTPVMSSPLLKTLAPVWPVNWPGLFFEAAQLVISCCAS